MASKRKVEELERTLFFTRLSPQISTQLLASKFQECPGFVDAATSGNKNGNGFVDFDNKANALMALSKFDGTILLDTELRISLQPPPGAVVPDLEPPESCNLFVYGFLPTMTRRKLREKFEEFGTVVDVSMPVDRMGITKHFAFIHFTSLSSAQEARSKLHRSVWDGRTLVVRYKDNHDVEESEPQGQSTPVAFELRSPNTHKKMRGIKADPKDENVMQRVVGGRTSEDFMKLSSQELITGMEDFDQSIVRGIQELREHTRNMFPDKSPAQHTRRIVAFQFGWVDRHLMDIKNMRVGFSTKEDLTPRLDDSLEKRQRRALLLFALSRIHLILEQMFVLNRFFPEAFPQWPKSLQTSFITLSKIMEDVIPSFETTFNSSLNVERLGKFIHEDANAIFSAISLMKSFG